MKKIRKTIMYKINLIVFFGLCLGFSSTLYGSQENDTMEEKKDQMDMDQEEKQNDSNNKSNELTQTNQESIKVSCWARLRGLVTVPKLNGRIVKVISYVEKKGRWTVKLLHAEQEKKYLGVREENLDILQQDEQQNDAYDKGNGKEEIIPDWDVNWKCKSIKKCKSFLCIVGCLKCWSTLDDTNKIKDIYKYLSSSNNYKNIINAYHHLLDSHLNNKEEYRYINEKVRKEVHCNFKTCQGYTRNQRERGEEENNKVGGIDVSLWKCSSCGLKNYIEQQHCQACFKRDDMCSNHPMKSNMDKEYIFLRDFLDTIHAYLIHGNESGHRYVKDDDSDIDEKKDTDDIDDLFDLELKKLKEWQSKIKKQKRNQDRGNKFQTKMNEVKKAADDKKISLDILKEKYGDDEVFKIWIQYLLENECDTDNILEQIDVDENETVIPVDKTIFVGIKKFFKEKQSGNEAIGAYDFGVRLYYWDYYKCRDANWWEGKNLYVEPCYLSLKNELLAKGIAVSKWNQKIYEAGIFLRESQKLKQLKAEKPKPYNTVKAYGFLEEDKIRVYHILSIIFYTNFTALCTEFSRSFRYLSSSESLKDVIKRNSKWYFLSKYLREVVGIFGKTLRVEAGGDPGDLLDFVDESSIFYHGITYLLFSSFSVHFYGPLSTSKQLEVATLFTNNDGLIVELKQGAGSGGFLRFFNVGLVSCFAAEDERLFIGGYAPLQISSIRLVKNNVNTEPLMHCLFVISSMIKGQRLPNNKVSPSDMLIFNKFLSGSVSKDLHLPVYVKQICSNFKNKQQIIKIHVGYMYEYYKVFLPLFFLSCPKFKNLLLFNEIIKIFPNVNKIICEEIDYNEDKIDYWGDKGDYSSSIVGSDFILGLKDILYQVEQNETNELKKIVIKTSFNEIKDDCNLFPEKFGQLGWKIRKEKPDDGCGYSKDQIVLEKK